MGQRLPRGGPTVRYATADTELLTASVPDVSARQPLSSHQPRRPANDGDRPVNTRAADESHTQSPTVGATRHDGERLVRRDEDGTYHATHDMDRDGLCTTIALAVAEVAGMRPTELVSTFSRYADPDGLNRLFRTRPNGGSRVGGHVELEIESHTVRVDPHGHIEVEPPTEN